MSFDEPENYITPEEAHNLQKVLVAAEMARNFLKSPEGIWFDDIVLKGLEEEAIETLKKGKNDEDRLRAQQMFLAAQKPRQILQGLVKQGEAAQIQISTHQSGG